MKLEVGQYIRTQFGVDKIKDIVLNGTLYEDSGLYLEKNGKLVCGKEEMKNLKASHNIIDIIEAGDYVNGYLIEMFYDTYNPRTIEYEDILGIAIYDDANMDFIEEIRPLATLDIKNIVTKEQFEAMAYKVV